jgi:hypothetical protein
MDISQQGTGCMTPRNIVHIFMQKAVARMKWKARVNAVGARRTVTKFAFIPTRLDNDYCIWWEYYTEDQEIHESGYYEDFTKGWETIARYQTKEQEK